jgi:hypothetical protein
MKPITYLIPLALMVRLVTLRSQADPAEILQDSGCYVHEYGDDFKWFTYPNNDLMQRTTKDYYKSDFSSVGDLWKTFYHIELGFGDDETFYPSPSEPRLDWMLHHCTGFYFEFLWTTTLAIDFEIGAPRSIQEWRDYHPLFDCFTDLGGITTYTVRNVTTGWHTFSTTPVFDSQMHGYSIRED